MSLHSPQPVSILLAEDSRIQAKILEGKLLEAGYQVRVAENGRKALSALWEQRPTLVISDIEMPEMNGYDLCLAVKTDPELKTIPFILLSTLSEPEDIIRGLHCGADNYVTKPYDPAYLLARIESLLATPLRFDEGDKQTMNVTLAGNAYTVNVGAQQVLNLLVSTFENAVEKNKELLRANEELSLAKEQLTKSNQSLEAANSRMQRDLDAAARVQQSLLPTAYPQTPQLRFAWKYLPCDELAGDFLNFFALDEQHVALFVVDVSGHGVASSLLSVAIARLLTAQVSSSSLLMQQRADGVRLTPPAEVAEELNRRFPMEEQNGLYFTLAYGVLDLVSREFRYVSAGHVPIVHLPREGRPCPLEADGPAIGFFEDLEIDEHVVQLEPGDRILLYSDGVPEAMDAELNEFSEQRMLEIIELGKSQPLDGSVDLLLSAVQRWCAKKGPRDDVSILAVEVTA